MHDVEVKIIKDTDKFRQAAIYFDTYGHYCSDHKGTTAYYEYWDREMDRCINGFTSDDGDYISGYNYFYLNYFRIYSIEIDPKTGKSDRVDNFPDFWDYDKAYFDAVEAAELGSKHLCVIKARGKGYSFKGGAMLCRNFYLIPGSKSYAMASETEFLTKDGLLTKAWEGMDFIDENTAWYKKRQKVDTRMHKRASIVVDRDGVKREIGYKSEIIGVSLKNNPNKARGKRGKLILWEEGGQFPDLKTAWQIARPSVEDTDHKAFGLMIAYGTGSTDDRSFDGLKDIFYEPDAYNCLHINNVWDDGKNGTPCGFFVPHYYNMGQYQDKYGNSNIKEAIKFELTEREKLFKAATDRTAVDRYIIEQPFSPMEACLQVSANIFPKAELIKHLAYIRNNKKILEYKQTGDLVTDTDGSVVWKQEKPKDITAYRVGKNQNTEGQIVIWEHPVENPPYGLYIAGCDSYDFDQSNSGSLGSIFIYKRFQEFDQTYDIIVAEYTGRPNTAEMFYERIRKLLTYYTAKLLFENQNPGLLTYFRNKHADYLLADQPDIIDKIVKKSTVSRAKGIHMNKEIKLFGEGLLKDWLIEERSDNRLNLHTIMSEPLLEELINYNPDGNYDRVMAMLQIMFYKEELYNTKLNENKEGNKNISFFSDPVFVNYGT